MKNFDATFSAPVQDAVLKSEWYMRHVCGKIKALTLGILDGDQHMQRLTRLDESLPDMIISDVFYKVRIKWDKLRDVKNLDGWLVKIIYTTCANYKRNNKRAKRFIEFDGHEKRQKYDVGFDYAATTENREREREQQDQEAWKAIERRVAIIKQHCSNLPEEDQELFHLRFEQHLKYPEIAKKLGITVAAASKRGRRLRDDLRNLS